MNSAFSLMNAVCHRHLFRCSFSVHCHQFSSVQFSCSVMSNSLRPHGMQLPGIPVHHHLSKFTQTHVHWIGDAIQPSHPLMSPSVPTFNLSRVRVFSNESILHIRWLKYWSFSFSISPFNEYSGLISFRVDWVDLLAVQARIMTPNQYPLYQPPADGTHTQSMTINKPNWLNAKICIV